MLQSGQNSGYNAFLERTFATSSLETRLSCEEVMEGYIIHGLSSIYNVYGFHVIKQSEQVNSSARDILSPITACKLPHVSRAPPRLSIVLSAQHRTQSLAELHPCVALAG